MELTILKQIGHGIECQVYEVNSKIVCKNYSQRFGERLPQPLHAEFAYRMQKIAYRAKLAPRPLALEDNQYYSEYVKCFDVTGYTGNWSNVKNTRKFREFLEKIANIFGTGFKDAHSGNVAHLPNGKLCLIDFGLYGFKYTTLGILLADKLKIKN